MRLLLVEDDRTFAKDVVRELGKIPQCEVVWARSRDGALGALFEHPFDLVILDRRVPPADDVLDDAPEHGWDVFQTIRTRMPGTSVWFLTGTVDADFVTNVLNEFSRNEDMHGTGNSEQMYQVFWKRKISDCLARVRAFASQRALLDGIAVHTDHRSRPLAPLEAQVVRLFGRRHAGAAVQVAVLSGGLSESRVLKVVVRRADEGFITTAVAKVSTIPAIEDEGHRYRQDICRLTPGGFPVLGETVNVGAGDRGGLFYGMVGDTVESLFDRIVANDGGVAQIPAVIRAIEGPWYQGKGAELVPVARIRRLIIPDTDLPEAQAQLGGIDIAAMEASHIQASPCCQHGDMHCANVVFDQRGQAMLIDFGDAGQSYASVDPVTLELSTIFHPQAARLPKEWPTEALLDRWIDADAFSAGCSFGEFVRSCRRWALEVASSPEEISAVGYAYALRQLKYDDTNKAFARSLIRACIAHVVG